RALEAVNAVGEDCEEAIHDFVPLFGVDLPSEIHRALHVSEEHGHLLPLAFEGAAGCQDLLGEVLGGVGAGIAFSGRWWRLLRRRAAPCRISRPCECGLLSPGNALNVDSSSMTSSSASSSISNCRRSIRNDKRPFSSR